MQIEWEYINPRTTIRSTVTFESTGNRVIVTDRVKTVQFKWDRPPSNEERDELNNECPHPYYRLKNLIRAKLEELLWPSPKLPEDLKAMNHRR